MSLSYDNTNNVSDAYLAVSALKGELNREECKYGSNQAFDGDGIDERHVDGRR